MDSDVPNLDTRESAVFQLDFHLVEGKEMNELSKVALLKQAWEVDTLWAIVQTDCKRINFDRLNVTNWLSDNRSPVLVSLANNGFDFFRSTANRDTRSRTTKENCQKLNCILICREKSSVASLKRHDVYLH